MMTDTSKTKRPKVCVIGAGICGITCIKSCIEENLDVTCFDKSPHYGGLWHYNNKIDYEPNNENEFYPSVMRTTILNTSKELSAFSDFPPPSELPNYMKHSLYMDYIKSYVDNFKLSSYIKLKHEILNCKPYYDNNNNQVYWLIKVKNLITNEIYEEKFDNVLVATGHHNTPYIPNFKDQDKFKGIMIHSLHVKDILTDKRFVDKNVLVIGIGNSALDAANDLALVAKRCYLSSHRGTWFISRLQPDGLYDFKAKSRYHQWLFDHLGTKNIDRELIKRFKRNTNHKLLGLEPKHKPSEQVPAINDLFPFRVFTGGINLKSLVTKFNENGVFFEGEEDKEYQIDSVIFATGYLAKMPFLNDIELALKVKPQSDEYELYLNMFAPKLTIPGLNDDTDSKEAIKSLAFIGFVQPSGSIGVVAELQSRLVAKLIQGQLELPSTKQMMKCIRIDQAQRSASIRSHSKDQIVGNWIGYQDKLAQMLQVKPNLFKLFLTDFPLWRKLFFGPSVPYQYRLIGPNSWPKARETIMTVNDRVMGGINEGKNKILYQTRSKSLREKQKGSN